MTYTFSNTHFEAISKQLSVTTEILHQNRVRQSVNCHRKPIILDLIFPWDYLPDHPLMNSITVITNLSKCL